MNGLGSVGKTENRSFNCLEFTTILIQNVVIYASIRFIAIPGERDLHSERKGVIRVGVLGKSSGALGCFMEARVGMLVRMGMKVYRRLPRYGMHFIVERLFRFVLKLNSSEHLRKPRADAKCQVS